MQSEKAIDPVPDVSRKFQHYQLLSMLATLEASFKPSLILSIILFVKLFFFIFPSGGGILRYTVP
jgi:hypothetical protein